MAAALLTLNLELAAQNEIALYGAIPNSKPNSLKDESTVNAGGTRLIRVLKPTLTVFAPQNKPDKGTAVIICPGGGYSWLAYTKEGEDIAKELNSWGVTAFVLKYRLPNDTTMQVKSIAPLQDAQRAIQLVRENAAMWNIDPQKIGIMGFSAGGHLAATLSTHFRETTIENPHGTSLRPDFSILIYPVISFTDSTAHKGSRYRLLGANPTPGEILNFSNELQINANTPPAFLVHASDDATVPVQNSLAYYSALLKNRVPAELHIYERGGHGFGLHNRTTTDKWQERLRNWMLSRKLLTAPAVTD